MEKIKVPDGLKPISQNLLEDEAIRLALCKQIFSDFNNDIVKLANTSMRFDEDEDDVKKIGCTVEIGNIKRSATAIAQYYGMIKMLLDNMVQDVKNIDAKQQLYISKYVNALNKGGE